MAFDLAFSFWFYSFKWFTYIVKGIFNPFFAVDIGRLVRPPQKN